MRAAGNTCRGCAAGSAVRGLPDPPPRAAPGGAGRGAGRAGLLPRLPAALRRGRPRRCTRTCSSARWRSRSSAALVVFALFGLYRHWMRYSSQREYLADRAGACVVATLALVGYVAVVQPRLMLTRHAASSSARRPDRRARALRPADARASSAARASLVAPRLRAPAARLPAAPRRALGADRRRRRRRPAAAARDPAQPGPRLPPGRLRRRRPAQAGRAHRRGVRVLGTTDELRRDARGRRARRGADRDPVGAGHAARQGRRARAASAACRCARCRRCSSCCRPAGALLRQVREVQRRGRPRPRARADGDRARRRLPDRARRARHGRRRLDRLRAVPPDRARRARAGSCWSTTPRTTCSRSSASSWRTATSLNAVAVLADCKEEERMREVFAEHRPAVVFHAAAYKHVGADGGQPGRGGAQQRARHARDDARSPASADAARSCSSRPTRPSRRRRSWARPRRSPSGRWRRPTQRYPDTAFCARALRQRARLVGLGRADLPPPDRARAGR